MTDKRRGMNGLAKESQVWTTIMSGTVTAARARQYYKKTETKTHAAGEVEVEDEDEE